MEKTKLLEYYPSHYNENTLNGEYAKYPEIMNLDIDKFGEYFLKCTGRLNSSIVKTPKMVNEAGLLVSCQKTIGLHFPSLKNNYYASKDTAFWVLNDIHLGLIKNPKRVEAVADFLQIKKEVKRRYNTALETFQKRLTENDLTVYKVANLVAEGGRTIGGEEVGHIKRNVRVVSTNKLKMVTNVIPNWIKHEYPENKTSMTYGRIDNLFMDVAIHDECYPAQKFGYRPSADRNLLSMRLTNDSTTRPSYTYTTSQTQFNHWFANSMNYIEGINFNKVIGSTIDDMNKLVKWFSGELEEMKEKHLCNFFLNSIGEDGCLI